MKTKPKEPKLTAINFFAMIIQEFPKAYEEWNKWWIIYREQENLVQLFNYGLKNRAAYGNDNMGWHNPGFEDLPHEMQMGILIYFFVEQEIEYGDADNFREDTFNCFHWLENKLKNTENVNAKLIKLENDSANKSG